MKRHLPRLEVRALNRVTDWTVRVSRREPQPPQLAFRHTTYFTRGQGNNAKMIEIYIKVDPKL